MRNDSTIAIGSEKAIVYINPNAYNHNRLTVATVKILTAPWLQNVNTFHQVASPSFISMNTLYMRLFKTFWSCSLPTDNSVSPHMRKTSTDSLCNAIK
ncbi:MAG: hypothetical protein ACI854_001789 [Arenicella sp.]